MSSTVMQRCRAAAGLVSFAVTVACDTPAAPQSSRLIEALSPTTLQGTVGAVVASAPTVVVKDRAGNPLPNVRVRFAAVSSFGVSGSVSVAEAFTNGQGVASSVEWTLSPRAGWNFLVASVEGASPIWFGAMGLADAPARLAWLDQYFDVGYQGMKVYPTLRVHDRFGNAVPNVTVTVAITGGSGSLDGASATTDQWGVASGPLWILGPGVNTITASVLDLPPVAWTLEALQVAAGYELETIDGESLHSQMTEFIAFLGDSRFVSVMTWSDQSGGQSHSISSGQYEISGASVVLRYTGGGEYQEAGTFEGDRLLLGRPEDDWGTCCSQWSYKKVSPAGP